MPNDAFELRIALIGTFSALLKRLDIKTIANRHHLGSFFGPAAFFLLFSFRAFAAPTSMPTIGSKPTQKSASSQPVVSSQSIASVRPKKAARGLIHFPNFRNRYQGHLGTPIHWKAHWPTFSTAEWITSASFGALAITSTIIGPVGSPSFGGVGPDESIRSALRLSNLDSRVQIRDASDITLTTAVTYPFVDALLVAGWYRRSPMVAKQMALINMEVMSITVGINSLLKSLVHRERPYGRICGDERPESTRDCDSNNRYYSFYSGHSAATFAAASVNCMHHAYLKLYDSPLADSLSCVAGYTLATTTGVLRIMGDAHYFTDVAMGAAMGTAVGLLVPWLFHYRFDEPQDHLTDISAEQPATFSLIPFGAGAAIVGRF